MCGITGLAQRELAPAEIYPVLQRMTDSIVHRGPDDEGFFVTEGVGLGMRRLSIIDLVGGKQPIHNESSDIHIVFNGEIYNYRDLTTMFKSKGHQFYTQSDTETIIHAYEEYGKKCVGYLRGMFGFALWDSKRKALLLAVDRFGIKPLYYAVNKQGIVFGSELKCILASGLVSQETDFEAMSQYFTLGYIPAPATIFQTVRKLSPGFILSWMPDSGLVVEQYWDLTRPDANYIRSLTETRHELREKLKDAVRSHLVSDVPIGVFLSGGIDSSTVVALMSEVSAEPAKTFSIGFADREHDELGNAGLVAKRFHTDHHGLIVEPETVEILPKLVAQFDEPFADPSALPTYYVSKMARQFVKVVLSGDGGDELFLGYTTFRGLKLARYTQWLPASLRRGLSALGNTIPGTRLPGWNDRVALFQKRLTDSVLPLNEAYLSKITMVGLSKVLPLLAADIQCHLEGSNPYKAVEECLSGFPVGDGIHPLERFVYTGLRVSLAGDMLVKVDRMSMANSLEVRVPLLDHELAEYVATIPIEQRFPRWRLKGLLKDTMADILPGKILNLPKHGFTIPLAAWFRGDLASYAQDILLSTEAQQRGLLNVKAIESLLREHRQGISNVGSVIWSLLVFELWCQQVLK